MTFKLVTEILLGGMTEFFSDTRTLRLFVIINVVSELLLHYANN